MSHPPQQAVYADNPRDEVVPFLPDGVRSALDVGCGRGGFGRSLRRRYGPGAHLVGVEPVPEQAAAARRAEGFDEVVDGYFPDALEGRDDQFDLVTYNDVLEHIVDPAATLRATVAHLTPTGRVVAAIPNVAYAPVVLDLVRNRWEYTDQGILDRTHLRFFTRASSIALFEENGFAVEACGGINSIAKRWDTDPLGPRRAAKRLLARSLGDHRYLHFVVVGRPVGGGRPAVTRG
jgi:2-polyprenyl-3-methyl-5-hydroxy-6-metoxy-1,4-benzoquinol methylase